MSAQAKPHSSSQPSGRKFGWLPEWLALRLGLSEPHLSKPQVDPAVLGPRTETMLACLEALAPVTASVEKRFLEISAGLESVSETSGQLLAQSELLIRLATGEEGGETAVQAAITKLMPPLTFLLECHAESTALNGRLKEFHGQIASTLAVEHDFQRTVEPLRFVQILFKVESATCEHAVQEMFLALVREIEKLHQQVSGIFKEQLAKLHQTQVTLDAVITDLSSSVARQQSVTISRHKHISESLEKLRSEIEKNRSIDFDLGRVSREIASETGRVVMALQFQDIINQKLQHVREAVLAMSEARGRALLAKDEKELGAELRFLEQTGRIVVGQIDQAEKDLAEAQGKITGGVRSILDGMEKLNRDCLALKELDSVAVGTDGLVQKLLDTFEEVARLVKETVSFSGRAHDVIRPVGDMASNVTGILRSLSREMHLIGLNAQIQSAQVGTGTGLEVLSSQTSEIAKATSDLSDRVAVQLDDLRQGLLGSIEAFERLHRNGVAHGDTLDRECPEETRALHEHRDKSIKALMNAGEQASLLGQQARPLLHSAQFDDITGNALPELRVAVDRLAKQAAKLADDIGASNEVTDRTNQFTSRYTMASERNVHMAALGHSDPIPSAPQSSGTGPIAGVADFDLFDAPSPVAAEQQPAAGAAPAQPSAADLGIDLWLEEAPVDRTREAENFPKEQSRNDDKKSDPEKADLEELSRSQLKDIG